MINTVTSMKSVRWGGDTNFKPTTFTPQQLIQHLEGMKGQLLWCECLSQRNLPKSTVTRLYIDRDLKRDSCEYSESERLEDFKMCMEKLNNSFGECDWAISQRHGYNQDKNLHCISWHFVCLDLYIQYTDTPFLLEQKGLDNIFDTAVYKVSEQLWQLPWCHKTTKDKRILTPINFKNKLAYHFVQNTENANDSNTIKIKIDECDHVKKRMKMQHIQPKDVNYTENKQVNRLQVLLKNVAKDTSSRWYKSDICDNIETHYYKTVGQRMCYVSQNEIHKSNNFVLNIRKGFVYYKCMSKECVRLEPRILGEVTKDTLVSKLIEHNTEIFDTNDLLMYKNAINDKLKVMMLQPKNTNDIVQQIVKQSANEIVKLLNKYFVYTSDTELVQFDINKSTSKKVKYTDFPEIKLEFSIWMKHPNKRVV